MTTNAPNKFKDRPLNMPKTASVAPPPPMNGVPSVNVCELQAEIIRLRKENAKIKKGLPVWRKASGLNNVGDNVWCILYSRLYGIGIGYWSPCYGWMFHKENLIQTDSVTHWMPFPDAPDDDSTSSAEKETVKSKSETDVDWKAIFVEVKKKNLEYINTDLAPWVTETYSDAEKKAYLELKKKAMCMTNSEIYRHIADNRIWQRVSREEMNRRSETKCRAPKNPSHEYHEPEACPWCGTDGLDKQDDGNYHCTLCGYDHFKERNAYVWDDK